MVPEIKIPTTKVEKKVPKAKTATSKVSLDTIREKVASEFAKASEEFLTRDVFLRSTEKYSGSISPAVAEEAPEWIVSGAIPPSSLSGMYRRGTLIDLSNIVVSTVDKPELEQIFLKVGEKAKKNVRSNDLTERVFEYQDALGRLASSSKILADTLSRISEGDTSWVETVKTNLDWIKKYVTMSIGKIYQGLGTFYDRVTKAVDGVIETLSRWSSSLKNKLVEGVRILAQRFYELLNTVISALFGWLSRVREIAAEKNFKLGKVTVTIDPMTFKTVFVLGFPVPIPEIKLPKIEMEFT